ncbi:hypothetical protein ACU60T_23585 [Klebsiella aerogenes]
MARKKPAPSGRSFRLHGPRLQILKNIAVGHRETLTESDVLHALVDCLEKNAVDMVCLTRQIFINAGHPVQGLRPRGSLGSKS